MFGNLKVTIVHSREFLDEKEFENYVQDYYNDSERDSYEHFCKENNISYPPKTLEEVAKLAQFDLDEGGLLIDELGFDDSPDSYQVEFHKD